MQKKNLHLAGEFIHMASLLMQIKVRMLLPRDDDETSEEAEDPRTELVQMLVEYRKFKEVCDTLRNMEEGQAKLYTVSAENDISDVDPDLFLGEVELIDLGIAFKELLDKMPKPKYYEVKQMKINLTQQIQHVRNLIEQNEKIKFSQIAVNLKNKIEVVVTFLAILELIKTEFIDIRQKTVFGEILIKRRLKEPGNVVANA